jgi:hypothetical protein
MAPAITYEDWRKRGEKNAWTPPPKAGLFWRLPIIRNIRHAVLCDRIDRHNAVYQRLGMIPTGYDDWVLYAIFYGWL